MIKMQSGTMGNASKVNGNGAFRLQDSVMPFDTNYEPNLSEKSNSRMKTLSSSDSSQKGSKKMKKEIHATTATGTLPLRKINKYAKCFL